LGRARSSWRHRAAIRLATRYVAIPLTTRDARRHVRRALENGGSRSRCIELVANDRVMAAADRKAQAIGYCGRMAITLATAHGPLDLNDVSSSRQRISSC
jgi:hypothetical protein